jgi:hypothetical protein
MSEKPRYFTLEQANAVVKMIRPLVEEILAIRNAIIARQPQTWPVVEKAAGNGGSREASQMVVEFERLDKLAREIRSTGAILKDINTGLVDFPTLREGQEVYLCWRYGEGDIEYWHEIETGFAGRKRLS